MLRKGYTGRVVPAAGAALLLSGMMLCGGGVSAAPGAGRSARSAQGAVGTGWTPRVESRSINGSGHGGEVAVNGVAVIRLRVGQAGMGPEQRSQIAADRLRNVIGSGLRPSDVTADLVSDRLNPRLKANGQIIVTASLDDARGTSSSPGGLVNDWASALRRALAVPGLTVSESRLLVPLNESRVLHLGGAARGPVTVALGSSGATDDTGSSSASGSNTADRKMVGIVVDPNSGDITVAGIAPGRDVLSISREGVVANVALAVQPYAGRFDSPRTMNVTGNNVSADLVARMAMAGALQAAVPNAGANVRITTDTITASTLGSGQTQTVSVPLTLAGPDMLPVSRIIRVTVTDTTLPPINTSTLFYSNNPERLSNYGTLFVGRMPKSVGATRLLYHHQSAMEGPIWFTVELINDQDTGSEVQVIGGEAGPVRDTVWVGYRAASDFMRSYLGDSGAVLYLPPHTRTAMTATRLGPGLTVSGIAQLRLVSGRPPLVRVAADIPGGDLSLPNELEAYPSTWTEKDGGQAYMLSDHIYPDPTKKVDALYQVGGRWAFVPLGRAPLQSIHTPDKKLDGNYGVFYDVSITLENPTDQEAKARIIFEPSAGLAGGVFLIDGKYVEIPQTNLPKETTLATYTIPAGGKQTVQLKTLPLSGSNYPATIIIGP